VRERGALVSSARSSIAEFLQPLLGAGGSKTHTTRKGIPMSTTDRRAFLAHLGGAAVAGGALAGPAVAFTTASAATTAAPDEPLQPAEPLSKEIVPGSPYPTFSRAVRCGGMVYVSGVLGQKPGTRKLASVEFPAQCRQAMDNLKASVEAAGSSLEKVVKVGAFLTDAADFAAFNEIYVTYFPADPPARSTVIVKALIAPEAKLEIDCVAFV